MASSLPKEPLIALVTPPTVTSLSNASRDPEAALIDRVFFALSDPVRRRILERLDEQALLVSELAAPFDISLQAVSQHIQVLVRAGLIRQERTGRVSRCSLVAGPIFAVAVWINRYSKYWQEQFDVLAAALGEIEEKRSPGRKRTTQRTQRMRTQRKRVSESRR
jgi:DNA-binding transcriptional ArsR family regulator